MSWSSLSTPCPRHLAFRVKTDGSGCEELYTKKTIHPLTMFGPYKMKFKEHEKKLESSGCWIEVLKNSETTDREKANSIIFQNQDSISVVATKSIPKNQSLLVFNKGKQPEHPSQLTLVEESRGTEPPELPSLSSSSSLPPTKGWKDPEEQIKQKCRVLLPPQDKNHKIVDSSPSSSSLPPKDYSNSKIDQKPQRKKIMEKYAPGMVDCLFCPQQFVTRADNLRHMKKTHRDPKNGQFSCKKCDYSTHELRLVEAHTMRLHANSEAKRFQCPKCQNRYESLSRLNQHVVFHSEERPFKCDKCSGVSFKALHHLKRHRKKFHEQKSVEKEVLICEICGDRFSHSSHRNLHVLKEHLRGKAYKCSQCDRGFLTETKLKQHEKNSHQHRETVSRKSGASAYECRFCSKEFRVEQARIEHEMSRHNQGFDHYCDHCGQGCESVADLNLHTQKMHSFGLKV